MSIFVTADEKAKTEFAIPVAWELYDMVKVQAKSLEEAYNYVQEHLDDIPFGDDGSYVDGSYEITVNNSVECICYQNTRDVVCTEFCCDDDLTKYTHEKQFDPYFDDSKPIAVGKFFSNGKTISISLKLEGTMKVSYKGELYDSSSDFPDELKERIKAQPDTWDKKDFKIIAFKAYQLTADPDDHEYWDVYFDLSAMPTKEKVLDHMLAKARKYFGISA